MDNEDKVTIQSNYIHLTSNVRNVKKLIQILIAKEIFTPQGVLDYQTLSDEEKKGKLFRDIQNRGSFAFYHLVVTLRELGQLSLAEKLDPSNRHPIPKITRFYNADVINKPSKKILVTKSKKFCDDQNSIPTYNCRSVNRGCLVIINNNEFRGDHNSRRGSLRDVDNLTDVFSQMNFEVERHIDFTAEQIHETVKHLFSSKEYERFDCVFLVIMSHGGVENNRVFIIGEDGERIYTDHIESELENETCPHLYGKPKVIIYNICRGNKEDKGVNYTKISQGTETDSVVENHRVPTLSNVLFGYSTIKGYVSNRDVCEGAWYILLLVQVFAEYAHDTNIEDMLKIVQCRLEPYRTTSYNMQTSSYTNIAFKRLYLNPGIYEEGGVMKEFENKSPEISENGANGNTIDTVDLAQK